MPLLVEADVPNRKPGPKKSVILYVKLSGYDIFMVDVGT